MKMLAEAMVSKAKVADFHACQAGACHRADGQFLSLLTLPQAV